MKRNIRIAAVTAMLIGTIIFGGVPVSAAEGYSIPDHYAAVISDTAIQWSDTDSTGKKAGAVIEKAIPNFGTLVCYYVPDNYNAESTITRESDKGTFHFVIGRVPGGPAANKRGMAAILCTPDTVPIDVSPAIFVHELQAKFGSTADSKATSTTPATPTPGAEVKTTETKTTYTDSEFIAEVIRLINAERENAGVKPLKADDKLIKIAGLKAKEMFEVPYFNHTSPNYGNPRQFAKHYGYKNYSGVGENLYRAVNAKPSEVVDWWMNSPGHKKNMLNPMYTKVGFGGYGDLFYALELAKK